MRSCTGVDGVDFDLRAVKLSTQFVGEQQVGQLGVLVRLQAAVGPVVEQEQVVQVQRLHSCNRTHTHARARRLNV